MSQPCRRTSGRNLTVAQDCTEYACVNMYMFRAHVLLDWTAMPTPYSTGHSTARST